MAPKPKADMSHAEIWDDSALVDSWNDALEEYKQYHSIQARGEDPQEVLEAGEIERNRVLVASKHRDNVLECRLCYSCRDDEMIDNEQTSDPASVSNAKDVSIENAASNEKDLRVDEPRAQVHNSDPVRKATSMPIMICESPSDILNPQTTKTQCDTNQATEVKHPALPQHLIGQVQDEGLKNLLMSWYYAGYYTGYYEGQHHGVGPENANPTD